MPTDTAAIDAKIYNAAVGNATLRGIWMTESRFDLNPQALEAEQDVPLAHSLRTHEPEVSVDQDGTILGFVRFEAASRRRRKRVMNVSAKYFISYRVAGSSDVDLEEAVRRAVFGAVAVLHLQFAVVPRFVRLVR